MIHASEQKRTDVKRQQEDWKEKQNAWDSAKLVFLDESGVNIDMTRRYGRARGGARVHDHVPLNKPQTLTMLSSIRLDGMMAYTQFSGALTGEIFLEYLTHTLAPTLRPGDVVIMDNLRCHKVQGVREAIEAVGAHVLYLPPYSPEFNPIEMLWSKLKSVLRTLKVRSMAVLEKAAPLSLCSVCLSDIVGWFQKSGYSVS